MLPDKNNSDNLSKPVAKKERYHCPFYGFNTDFGVMMDQEGNQCALIKDSYSPCRMEVRKETPDWNKCPFNNSKLNSELENVVNRMKVFPKEFFPQEAKSWEGMTLKEWKEYVMKENISSK